MQTSEIKKSLKNPRRIITEIAGITDVYLSEILNEAERVNPEAMKARVTLNVAEDVALGLQELEAKLKDKYSVIK